MCVDKEEKSSYTPEFHPLIKADPICISGYYSEGFCFSCLGSSEHSNGQCLSPCYYGSPSDYFCIFEEVANKKLSLIDDFWSKYIRQLYQVDFLRVIKSYEVSKDMLKDFTNLRDISNYLIENKSKDEVQNLSGKFMIYLRDKFVLNLENNWQDYMKSIYYKLFMRFETDENNTKNVLAVVNDLIYFTGKHDDSYLENRIYKLESLVMTVANILDRIC